MSQNDLQRPSHILFVVKLKEISTPKKEKKNTTLCTTLKKLRKGGDFTREKDARYLQQFGDTQLQRKLL